MKNTTNSNQPYTKFTTQKRFSASPQEQVIYLGIDQHAASLVVVSQENACVPSPARKFCKVEKLYDTILAWQKKGFRVLACYEAGPCGFWLCRKLEELGVACLVVAPKKWSENGKVKTDARDARVLCERLFQYSQGRYNVFSPVRVPSPEEEDRRNLARNRERMIKERKRLAQSGRGIGLQYQLRLKGQWWKGGKWGEASHLEDLLGPIREIILALEKQIAALTAKLETHASSPSNRPAGLGAMTDAALLAEVGDYNRFGNRRAPGAFTGLVPGEESSGERRKGLPITKTGRGSTRRLLVEAAWRLIRFQPEWRAWKKWKEHFEEAPKWRRNQIIVALARELFIDLWRLHTERCSMEQIGWSAAKA